MEKEKREYRPIFTQYSIYDYTLEVAKIKSSGYNLSTSKGRPGVLAKKKAPTCNAILRPARQEYASTGAPVDLSSRQP